MRDIRMEPFGEDILGRADKDWGLDDKGEINGSYRSYGFPGRVMMHGPLLIRTVGVTELVRLQVAARVATSRIHSRQLVSTL